MKRVKDDITVTHLIDYLVNEYYMLEPEDRPAFAERVTRAIEGNPE
ncbi:MAG TPA: hypothetical protein VEM32_11535 [Geobacteraceae bacterium]|nr:hypothetical protein [Geobacteraceae bacterium]